MADPSDDDEPAPFVPIEATIDEVTGRLAEREPRDSRRSRS